MSTIPIQEIERSRRKPGGLNHVSAPSANDVRIGEEACGFALGGRT
jgi:hypothetical protein